MSSVTDGRAISSTFSTEGPSNSGNDINVPNLVIPIVVLVIVLVSCGVVVCYIIKQRQRPNAGNWQRKYVKGEANPSFHCDNKHDNSNSNDKRTTRESGAYKSYDAISVDMRDFETHNVHPKRCDETSSTKQSKERTTHVAQRNTTTDKRQPKERATSGVRCDDNTNRSQSKENTTSDERQSIESRTFSARSIEIAKQRQSKESTTSGAYMCFDDIGCSSQELHVF